MPLVGFEPATPALVWYKIVCALSNAAIEVG
jgi:hypothetical protein